MSKQRQRHRHDQHDQHDQDDRARRPGTTVTTARITRPSIEVSTLIKPRNPLGSEPSRDDDPTGVRALLSAMPEPEPMPQYLVERINASLAAEQAERAGQPSGASVTPLISAVRHRPGRLVFAIAGVAAAVTLVAVIGNSLLTQGNTTATSGGAVLERSLSARDSGAAATPGTAAKAPAVSGAAATPAVIQIGQSGTRYTQADFVTQAQSLRRATPGATSDTSALGPVGTTGGLTECLSAIGVTGAQVVHADVAVYQGQPAVIIVTTTNGVPMAYAVGARCSRADAAVLRPATPLP